MALILLVSKSVYSVEKVTYYHNDHLGSPVAATDGDGNVVWRESYQPFGTREQHQGDAKNTLWFTGKQEENFLGLSYFGARWYDPEMGRFLAIDPVGVTPGKTHSFNRYTYANNNPYKFIDPDGKESVVVEAYVIFGWGGGLTVGENPDGSTFLVPRIGYGFGGGAQYDPNGTSPGYNENDKRSYQSLGWYGEANVALLIAYVASGGKIGYRTGYDGGSLYGDPIDVTYGGVADGKFGARFGASTGLEAGFVEEHPITIAIE